MDIAIDPHPLSASPLPTTIIILSLKRLQVLTDPAHLIYQLKNLIKTQGYPNGFSKLGLIRLHDGQLPHWQA